MKKKRKLTALLPAVVGLAVLLVFLAALSNLQEGRLSQGRQQLEDAVRRGAVACYAAEGIYPPNLEYLEAHYGIQVDRNRYVVIYHAFASNLMPEITVLING